MAWPRRWRARCVAIPLPVISSSSGGRRGDMIKVLWWDGDGLCLLAKRLERGRFVWPWAESGAIHLSAAQLSMLLEGIDWRRPERTASPSRAG